MSELSLEEWRKQRKDMATKALKKRSAREKKRTQQARERSPITSKQFAMIKALVDRNEIEELRRYIQIIEM